MAWVIADLQKQTSQNGYDFCYGALSAADSDDCLCEAPYKRILVKCSRSYRGQLQLQDCRMRFEQYLFIE